MLELINTNNIIPKDIPFKELLLPQIPQSFIEEYITAYNSGNPIIEVNVEYGYKINKSQGPFHQYRKYFIKTNSNNCIIINKVKDSWNKDQLIILLNKFGSHVYGEYTRNTTMAEFTDNWIQQNL